MKIIVALVIITMLTAGCESDDGSNQSDCPNLAGDWKINVNCSSSTDATVNASGGMFTATVSQNGCDIKLTQKDDQTSTEWVSSGTITGAGNTTLFGEFGFTSAEECDGQVTDGIWTATCATATGSCALEAEKP